MPEQKYDNEARFVIFPNAKKEKDNQPDYTGEMTLDGVKYRLSGWRNTSKGGVTYVAGKVGSFDFNSEGNQPSNTNQSATSSAAPANDDIPF